ncbi:uncharacterized protein LOC125661369 [Ostrea edulis]|uniref:uncharacterized protein LOC125661369 n=1 Tax=Ostrea edulis TaxID=37623 RepID=UPI0024AF029D|nr:uncharacterized protein LOC125661369 [Ostrea edulis]
MKTRKILPTVGNIVDLTIPEEYKDLDMTEEENDDLASYLITTYKSLQRIDSLSADRVGQVVLFVAERVKESERQGAAPEKRKTRTGKRKMDEEKTQRKKRKLEETGSKEFTCTYCFAYTTKRRDRIKRHMDKCPAGPKDAKEREAHTRRSIESLVQAHEDFNFLNPYLH